MSHVFEGALSTPEALEALGERNFVAAMLRFEAALARAQGAAGLIPENAALSITDTCKVELFDVAKIVRDSARAGNLAIPLVCSLKETVGLFNPQAVDFVHYGSASQDVIDTGMVLVTRDVLIGITHDVRQLVQGLLTLAQDHTATPLLARTALQAASITSFGLKCAGWAAPLLRGLQRLQQRADQALCLQLGGAVGTLAQMQGKGAQVMGLMARELQLKVPPFAWHTQRDEWVALGCALGLLVGSLGKMAKDISLMAQPEIGEVAEVLEPGPASVSPLTYQHSALGSMVALAAAQRVPQRIAVMLAAMPQEHERGLGGLQAEWAEWPLLLMSCHGAARAMAQTIARLQVDTGRMHGNLQSARASLTPSQSGDWFNSALVQQAGALTQTLLVGLRADLGALDATTAPVLRAA
jgi:3-carboxy-cis,cis-muconate cycloisomerase